MICYKDRSYCKWSNKCEQKNCADRFTDKDAAAAAKWWNGPGAPVQFENYQSNTCGFKSKEKDEKT